MQALLVFVGKLALLAILKVVCLLVAIAYYTLAERKIMAALQRRVGPNVVGFIGLLQPLADGLKLAGKEMVTPSHASSRIFIVVAMAVLGFALLGWTIIPFQLFDHSAVLSTDTVCRLLADTDASTRGSYSPRRFLPPPQWTDARYVLYSAE